MKKMYKLISALVVLLCLSSDFRGQNYCIPVVSSPAADDEIRYVLFGTMSNTTGCSVVAPGPGSIGGAYSNFTGSTGVPNLAGSVPAPVAIMGNSYPLSAGLTMCASGIYSGIFGAFIDYNQNGSFLDPGENVWNSTYPSTGALSPAFNIFSAPGVGITIPFTATPGLTRLRIWQSETSVMGGPCGNITWGEVEDYVINIVPPTPCSTTPGANSIVTTTNPICPNTNTPLSLLNTYTVGNIGYQWSYSTNGALGPFTVIPTASTTAALASPILSVTSWFQLNTWCANGGSTLTTAAAMVSVSPVTTTNVPYYEGFEGIQVNNQLPNCSWMVNNANAQTYISSQANNRIPRTGSKFASVYGYNMNGTNYYYTNGIYMYPGITYSASLFFTTEYYGYTNFTELSIKYGPNQSPTGLINIVTQSVAVSPVYKELANTFTVATGGLYYVAIKIVSSANNQYANYLSWDDFSITIPCHLNTPVIGVTANSSTICAGQPVNLTATGANNYVWNTGATTATITDFPTANTTYVATGTSTLTNCSASMTKNITVKPTPVVSIVASNTAVCEGSSINLVAIGAASYTWDNGSNSGFISVNPTANTTYTVLGSYANNNCTGQSTQMITVNPLPNISAINSPATSCPGQNVNMTGSGATTYQWIASSGYVQGNPVIVNPTTNTTYSLTGTDENGCSKVITINQTVVSCVGINEHSGTISGLNVYPNPNNGEFTIEVANGQNKTIAIMDVTGRLLLTQTTVNDQLNVNMTTFANGVYYVKVTTSDAVEVLKLVKQ
ncbi:MAG: GEVED domain-containing protein [Bacteroidota bacterium]